MQNIQATTPLVGIKVVEIGQNIAGPYASEILASMGAEVIKIEREGAGDDARGWGPPFWRGTATTFQAMNHGKKSLALDLKNSAHIDTVKSIVAEADVFIHNMRPGAIEDLGLSSDVLMALSPGLIYCSLGAFGHTGPRKMTPGYEPMVQAFSGIFSINGPEDAPPSRVGMQVLDLGTGVWAALGCLAALYRRSQSGQGCTVDASLFETALSWLQVMIAGFNATGKQPARHRSGNPNVVVFQALPTADGEVVVAAANDRLFFKLAKAVGYPEWTEDPNYASNALRVQNKAVLIPLLEAVFRQQPSDHWLEVMEQAGIPCAPIQNFEQVIADEQTKALDIIQNIPNIDLPVVALPISFDKQRPRVTAQAPQVGEHNDQYLPSTTVI